MTILLTKKALNLEKELQDKVNTNNIPYPTLPIILYSILFTLIAGILANAIASMLSVGIAYIGIIILNIKDVTTIETILITVSIINVILTLIVFVIACRFIPTLSLKLGLKTCNKIINSNTEN